MRAAEYYLNGFVRGSFIGQSRVRLIETLNGLFEDVTGFYGPRFGWRWEQKYPNTYDLRPTAHDYDPSIMGALFEADVPGLLADVIAPDMTLFHIQVRRAAPGPSYMDWHRDTYRHGGKVTGNTPPVHKLIFYPLLGRDPESKLKLAVGSHRRMFDDQTKDLKIVEGGSPVGLPVDHYNSSDDGFILFDTSMMHGVVPDTHPVGSVRIIYSFIRSTQFDQLYAGQQIHVDQRALYEGRLRR